MEKEGDGALPKAITNEDELGDDDVMAVASCGAELGEDEASSGETRLRSIEVSATRRGRRRGLCDMGTTARRGATTEDGGEGAAGAAPDMEKTVRGGRCSAGSRSGSTDPGQGRHGDVGCGVVDGGRAPAGGE